MATAAEKHVSKVAWHLTMTLDELDVNRSFSMIINGFADGCAARS